ncbi:hypothetical protein EBT31_07465 [bacterium]|nr:hypothetical protein [bacterium]
MRRFLQGPIVPTVWALGYTLGFSHTFEYVFALVVSTLVLLCFLMLGESTIVKLSILAALLPVCASGAWTRPAVVLGGLSIFFGLGLGVDRKHTYRVALLFTFVHFLHGLREMAYIFVVGPAWAFHCWYTGDMSFEWGVTVFAVGLFVVPGITHGKALLPMWVGFTLLVYVYGEFGERSDVAMLLLDLEWILRGVFAVAFLRSWLPEGGSNG